LLRLVPLVECHLDRVSAGVTFHLDPADLDDAGRVIDDSMGSDVESAPLVTNSLDVLGRETLGDQRSDGQILGLLLLLATKLGVGFQNDCAELGLDRGVGGQNDCRPDVPDRAGPGRARASRSRPSSRSSLSLLRSATTLKASSKASL